MMSLAACSVIAESIPASAPWLISRMTTWMRMSACRAEAKTSASSITDPAAPRSRSLMMPPRTGARQGRRCFHPYRVDAHRSPEGYLTSANDHTAQDAAFMTSAPATCAHHLSISGAHPPRVLGTDVLLEDVLMHAAELNGRAGWCFTGHARELAGPAIGDDVGQALAHQPPPQPRFVRFPGAPAGPREGYHWRGHAIRPDPLSGRQRAGQSRTKALGGLLQLGQLQATRMARAMMVNTMPSSIPVQNCCQNGRRRGNSRIMRRSMGVMRSASLPAVRAAHAHRPRAVPPVTQGEPRRQPRLPPPRRVSLPAAHAVLFRGSGSAGMRSPAIARHTSGCCS